MMLRALALGTMLWAGFWQTAPAQKVDVNGAWDITFTKGGESRTGLAILSQDGTAVTGMIGPGETEMMPATGTVSGNQLTLMTHPRRGRVAAFAKCELTVEGDHMSGTIDTDNGKIEFVRRRRPPVRR